jgi:autotransporter-associated beta strand protein
LTIAAGGSGSIGVSNLSGGTFNSPSGGILVGERGNGTLNVSGTAVVTVAGNGITMGDVDSGGQTGWNGTVNLLGGTIVTNKVAKGNISTGGTGVATFNFNGGTLQASTPNATFMTGLDNAYVNGAFGVYSGGGTIDNGGFAITIGQSLIAPTGNGVRATGLTVSGGGYIGTPLVVITNAASDTTGTGAKAVATLKPDGTTLDKIIITNPGVGYTAAPTFALVGGGNGNTGAIGGAATLVDNTLSSGGLTFTGTGTTTLSSANTYTGATLVNAGTLFLGPSGSINSSSGITINGSGAKLLLNTSAAITPTVNVTNGTFGGIGTVNNVVVDVGGNGIITASDVSFNALSIGSLTFNGAGAISLTIDQSTAYQALNVTTLTTGAVNTSGKVSLNASTTGSSWAPATYNLIYYSSLGGVGYGAFQPGTVTGLSNRQSATFSNDSNYIKMKIAGDVPKWTGLVNGNWTVNAITPVGGNTNWVLMTAGTATDFITGDVVTFDDSAPTAGGTTNVIISDANVGPASVAFNNSSSYTYTISSASETTYGIVDYVKSGITYPTSLLVEGGGAVSLNSTNTYSGGTTVSGGTLNINNASAIGTGTLTLDNISTYYSVTLDNTSSTDVTLTTDNPQIWNCNFAFTGTRNLNLGAGAVTMSATRTITVNAGTLTVGGAIGGSGFGLTKAGTGALTLGGANTYTGATIVSAGTLNVTGTVSGTQLDQVGNTSSSDAKLVISSGGSFTANLPGSAWSSSIDVGATGSAAGSVQMSGSTSSFTVNQQIALGNAGYGAFTQSAGTTTIGGFIACGGNNSSGGILNQSGGTITLTGAPITVGYVGTTGLGVMNLSGSAVFNANGPAGNGVWIGELGTAVLNVSGSAALNINSAGTLTGGGGLVLGRTNTTLSNGTVNLLGGTITTPFVTKGTGTGTLNFNGGTLKASADNATFLTGLTNAYVYNSGATIDDGGYAITIGQALLTPTGSNGVSASGLTVSGSGFIDTPLVSITGGGGGSGATAIATINYTTGALSGITITSPGTGYTTAPTFTLLGGGVGSSYSTTSGALSIVANAGGGLTKLGTGTVTITGANTYSGATAVNDGTLILSGAGSINGSSGITINGSTTKLLQTSSVAVTPTVTVDGTLDGTGIVNTVIVASGAGNIIANGNGGPGALTIGSLTFNGVGKISLNTAGSVALITTSLTTGASASSITVNVSNASWTSGTVYDLISYNNLLGTAGFSAFTKGIVTGLTPRQGSNLVPDGNNIALSITATSGSPVWTGAQNSKWRATPPPIGGLGNWQISLVPDEFITGDSVLFDNTAPGFTTVDISDANVAPTSTTFNNTTLSYIISSSGGYGISSGYLAKNGTGTVTITTSNTYAGVTIVNAGTLNINNASAIGTGVLTLTGGTIDASAGYIALTTNNAQSWNGDFTFKGTNNLNLGTGDVTLGGTAGSRTVTVTAGDLAVGSIPVATAGYGLTKAGAGTLSLTGASTNNIAGTLNITGGTVEIASDLYVTGLTGSGTIQAYTSASKWLYITNATDDTFAGVIQDGAGLLGLRKLGAGKLTLNGSINYSMETSVGGGTLVFSGTTNNTTAVDTIGDTAGANGVLIISSGANFSANDPVGQFTSSLAVGTNATSAGSVKLLAGGTLTTASQFGLGTGTGGYAAYTQTGGTANVGSYFVLGFNNDRSVANISGGSLNIGSNVITVGAGGTGSIGVLNLSGTVTVTSTATTGYGPTIGGIFVGENGAGTLNVSGNASLTLTGWGLRIGHNSGASGTVNLRGGTVTTTAVSRGSGTGALNFNGGTLKASGDTTTFLTGLTNTYVYSNGAIIDDGGKAITIGQVLLAPTGNGVSATGLTVSGSGFIDTPLVTITNASGDSTGAGATAIATINSDGSLAGITITNPGLGYTAAPTFALVGGGVGNTGAITGTATLVANTSGGLTKLGAGTMTLTASSTYTGNTTISDGTLALVSGGDISASSAISTGGSGTFEVDSGDHTVGTISGTGTTKVLSGSLTATSIVQDTLDIGSGSWATLNTATIDGGSTSGSLSEVPEPATWAMLMLAALGLGIYWRRRR